MIGKLLFCTILAIAMFFAPFTAPVANAQEVIKITAKQFEFTPNEITVKKGVPVILEFTSADRLHGFDCPGLNIRTDIEKDKTSRVEFTPAKAGTYPFHCDNFCGSGHGKMQGKIIVTE